MPVYKHPGIRIADVVPPHWRFRYTNWKGSDYEYRIVVEGIEFGPYDASGATSNEPGWALHGWVITRDGDARPEMGTRRRTFLLNGIRDLVVEFR